MSGFASAGETVSFSAPFRARPAVVCSEGLRAAVEDVTPLDVTFGGEGVGAYQIIGE